MMVLISNARSMFLRNWFWPVAVLVVIGDLSSVYLGGWSDSQIIPKMRSVLRPRGLASIPRLLAET